MNDTIKLILIALCCLMFSMFISQECKAYKYGEVGTTYNVDYSSITDKLNNDDKTEEVFEAIAEASENERSELLDCINVGEDNCINDVLGDVY